MTATSTNPFLSFNDAVRLQVAVADQQHTLRRVAALTPGRTVTSAPGSWFATVAVDLLRGMATGRVRLCPHLGPQRGFGPMFCQLQDNPEVMCKDCLASQPHRLSPVEEFTCDRCKVYARGLITGALPVGPLLLMFGVCGTCSAELGISVPDEEPARV